VLWCQIVDQSLTNLSILMLSDKEINIEHGAASSLKSNGNEPQQQRQEPSPIPNGGLAAWSQVLGAHLLFFNSW
jgi:hypothetical protein